MSDDYARIQPKYAWSFTDRVFKLLRQLDRHRERYIRAWMAHYGLHPAVCHIVTFPKTVDVFGDERGEIMRMECRAHPDHVAELVKAADEAAQACDFIARCHGDEYDMAELADASRAIRAALKPFTREDKQ